MTDLHEMTPEQLRVEIAEVLARGCQRLLMKKVSEEPERADKGPNSASEKPPKQAEKIP